MSQERLIEDVLDSLNFQRDKYISTLPVEQIEINEYSRTHIKFDAPPEVRIDYNCDLPLFRENRFFDSSFINTFIQQKVLAQIGQFRSFIYEDLVDLLEQDEGHYFLDIGHSIPLINESNLSIIINYNYYFGGAHPNTEIDTLNFSLKPECLLKFSDIFDLGYNTLHNTIKALLTQFGSDEQKTHLINYINYFNEDNIEYCFRGNALDIIFINQAPRVIMAISILEIPLKNIGSDHIKIRLTNCA